MLSSIHRLSPLTFIFVLHTVAIASDKIIIFRMINLLGYLWCVGATLAVALVLGNRFIMGRRETCPYNPKSSLSLIIPISYTIFRHSGSIFPVTGRMFLSPERVFRTTKRMFLLCKNVFRTTRRMFLLCENVFRDRKRIFLSRERCSLTYESSSIEQYLCKKGRKILRPYCISYCTSMGFCSLSP